MRTVRTAPGLCGKGLVPFKSYNDCSSDMDLQKTATHLLSSHELHARAPQVVPLRRHERDHLVRPAQQPPFPRPLLSIGEDRGASA